MYRRPNEVRPNEVRPNEIRPNEIRPNVATPYLWLTSYGQIPPPPPV